MTLLIARSGPDGHYPAHLHDTPQNLVEPGGVGWVHGVQIGQCLPERGLRPVVGLGADGDVPVFLQRQGERGRVYSGTWARPRSSACAISCWATSGLGNGPTVAVHAP